MSEYTEKETARIACLINAIDTLDSVWMFDAERGRVDGWGSREYRIRSGVVPLIDLLEDMGGDSAVKALQYNHDHIISLMSDDEKNLTYATDDRPLVAETFIRASREEVPTLSATHEGPSDFGK